MRTGRLLAWSTAAAAVVLTSFSADAEAGQIACRGNVRFERAWAHSRGRDDLGRTLYIYYVTVVNSSSTPVTVDVRPHGFPEATILHHGNWNVAVGANGRRTISLGRGFDPLNNINTIRFLYENERPTGLFAVRFSMCTD